MSIEQMPYPKYGPDNGLIGPSNPGDQPDKPHISEERTALMSQDGFHGPDYYPEMGELGNTVFDRFKQLLREQKIVTTSDISRIYADLQEETKRSGPFIKLYLLPRYEQDATSSWATQIADVPLAHLLRRGRDGYTGTKNTRVFYNPAVTSEEQASELYETRRLQENEEASRKRLESLKQKKEEQELAGYYRTLRPEEIDAIVEESPELSGIHEQTARAVVRVLSGEQSVFLSARKGAKLTGELLDASLLTTRKFAEHDDSTEGELGKLITRYRDPLTKQPILPVWYRKDGDESAQWLLFVDGDKNLTTDPQHTMVIETLAKAANVSPETISAVSDEVQLWRKRAFQKERRRGVSPDIIVAITGVRLDQTLVSENKQAYIRDMRTLVPPTAEVVELENISQQYYHTESKVVPSHEDYNIWVSAIMRKGVSQKDFDAKVLPLMRQTIQDTASVWELGIINTARDLSKIIEARLENDRQCVLVTPVLPGYAPMVADILRNEFRDEETVSIQEESKQEELDTPYSRMLVKKWLQRYSLDTRAAYHDQLQGLMIGEKPAVAVMDRLDTLTPTQAQILKKHKTVTLRGGETVTQKEVDALDIELSPIIFDDDSITRVLFDELIQKAFKIQSRLQVSDANRETFTAVIKVLTDEFSTDELRSLIFREQLDTAKLNQELKAAQTKATVASKIKGKPVKLPKGEKTPMQEVSRLTALLRDPTKPVTPEEISQRIQTAVGEKVAGYRAILQAQNADTRSPEYMRAQTVVSMYRNFSLYATKGSGEFR